MQLVTDTASRPAVVAGGVVVTLVLLLSRRWAGAAAAAVAVVAAGQLTTWLKTLTERSRPPADQVLGTPLESWSFPSGHTLQGTVLAGLVAAVLVALVARGRRARTVVVALAAADAAAVGVSRIYLGHHWLTDVVAGWLVAGALLSVAVPVVLAGARRPADVTG